MRATFPVPPFPADDSPAPTGVAAQGAPQGTVYLLHFDQRYEHAGHYTGFAERLDQRLAEHQRGTGARLVEVITQAGIGFRLARIWPGASRARERQLKNTGGASRYCPICQDERKARGEHRRPPRGRGDRPADQPARAGSVPPERHRGHQPAAVGVPNRGVRPSQAREFMRLNPKFARPVSASLAKQWGRVRGREEVEALGPRVTGARFEENQQLSQQRTAAVTRRAVQARVQARQQQLADHAERTRTQAVAARTYQRLTTERSPRRPHQRDRNQQTTSSREGGHER